MQPASSVIRRTVAGAACWWLALSAGAAGQPFEVEVTHHARGVQPGEAVLVYVSSPERLAAVEGTIFDRAVHFHHAGDGSWRGLVGIDLMVEPGDHDLVLRVAAADGSALTRVHRLAVTDKQYPTRRLRVEPRYVEPPPEVAARIEREFLRQTAIFATDTPERLWRGPWIRPVPGRANGRFGARSVFNGQPRNPHSGADFLAGVGTPVAAPAGGRVVLAGDTYFSGGSVILDHGWGLYSYLAHLSRILVEEGDLVEKGDVVARSGATGRVTGPHLHWTVRMSGARVDPLSVIEILQD